MRHTAAIILLILAAASASMMPGACAEGVPVPVAENVRGNGDTLALASAANDPKLMLADLVVLILRWSLGCAEGVLFAENVTVTPVMERNMIISMIVTTSTEKDIIPWKKWAFEVWNGKGKINYDDGSEYVGDKWTNMAEIDRKWSAKGYGEGNMKYKDGSEYSGKWFDGKRHGEGIQKWANGDVVFDGEWWIDCWRRKCSVSSEYHGEWFADKRHGKGIMKYRDGSEYIGNWLDGKRHGNGILKGADGDVVFDGEWSDNYPMSKDELSFIKKELNCILLALILVDILVDILVVILVVFWILDIPFEQNKFLAFLVLCISLVQRLHPDSWSA